MPCPEKQQAAMIPMQTIGPLKVISPEWTADQLFIPLATFESPLWPSTQRGARACTQAGGIRVVLLDDRMTRSTLVEADSVQDLQQVYCDLQQQHAQLQAIVRSTSRFAQLLAVHMQIIGSLLYIRWEFSTGDAAGHNMTTLAAESLLDWLLARHPYLRYVSISGNYCTDKKVSAVNGILGRGKYTIAEVILPYAVCTRWLHTTPEKIVALNVKKNLLGSIVAGGVRTANAHFANILLAFYLATGQDAANIIEASQGMVYAEVRGEGLYFSVSIPNVIVGTQGRSKQLAFVQENLALLGCLTTNQEVGYNARRLAMIAAAVVLCGELSLLAAQTNRGELMQAHLRLERSSL